MRRRAAAVLLAVLFVPASLRLAGAAVAGDPGRAHCPLRCAHHGDAADGSACCPLDAAPESGCSLSRCATEESPVLAVPLPGQPVILASILRLPLPAAARVLTLSSSVPPRGAPPLPPDHVPLLFV